MKTQSDNRVQRRRCAVLVLGLLVQAGPAWSQLPLQQAVAIAQASDPWLDGSKQKELALVAQGEAAGSLPDPLLSAGFANLPTDTFDFNQEAMTQFTVGLTQVLPRGDSRELRQRQFDELGRELPFTRQDRRAQVAVSVAELWLDAWLARESIRLIEDDRELFEQLVSVAESRYATALGGTSQNDLVRAQLELTRLDDRLASLRAQRESAQSRLRQWLPAEGATAVARIEPASGLPALQLLPLAGTDLTTVASNPSPVILGEQLQQHPAIRGIDRRLDASQTGIDIAEQGYRPEWRLNASYGYREDDPAGMDRPDFFSVGVAVDLPLFSASRQDKQVQAATASAEAVRTERALALRRMVGEFLGQWSRLQRLEERRALYRDRLLPEIGDQAQAALAAYTHDAGDFAEVVRARIDELNAHIDALSLDVERLKSIARINYYLQPANDEEPAA
ncbi:TolC family protein [Haliea sp. E17]|uniref:TolC family protein n=1 Tax=Haliea sp. E17 TaxID=3401576 RepID=UPI003AAD0ED5